MADESSTSKYGKPEDNPTQAPPRMPARTDAATYGLTSGTKGTGAPSGSNMRSGK